MSVTVEQAIDRLTAQGHAEADVVAVVDALIAAGLELEQPDDGTVLTEGEVELVRADLVQRSRMTGPEVLLVRRRLAMTVDELAESLAVNPRTVRAWESGRDTPGEWLRPTLDQELAAIDARAREAVEQGHFELVRGSSRDLATAMRARELDQWILLDWTN